MFITFEGGEGSGKSTQIKLLYKYLTSEYRKYKSETENNIDANNEKNNKINNNLITQEVNKNNTLHNNILVQDNSLNKNNARSNQELLVKPEINYESSSNKVLVNKALYNNLCNKKVVITREPGGTIIADQLRNILVQGKPEKMNAITEALMFLAARADCWNKVIKPALDSNKIVISDRFHDSTLVYQGICCNIDINLLNIIYKNITNNIFPDRTYIIDIDPVIGLKRSLRKDNKDIRFEMKSLEYHKKIRDAYLQIAKNNNRYLIIDGNLSIQEINSIIVNDINNLLNKM